MKVDELDHMRTFVRVVELGSFSRAAAEMRVGQPAVSRQIRDLELDLATTLLQRTTRQLALTESGELYYRHARAILAQVEEAHEQVAAQRAATAGRIRMSCTSSIGTLHLCRMIFAFQNANPGIEIDLGLTDERIDLVREGVDVAIRLGPLRDSSLIMRDLGRCERLLVASPEYLKRRGAPKAAADLSGHNALRYAGQFGDRLPMIDPAGVAAMA